MLSESVIAASLGNRRAAFPANAPAGKRSFFRNKEKVMGNLFKNPFKKQPEREVPVYVTGNGRLYVKPEELFKSEKVRKEIAEIAEFFGPNPETVNSSGANGRDGDGDNPSTSA